jgi:NTE family protein
MNTTPFSTLHVTAKTASGQPGAEQIPAQTDPTARAHTANERALVLGGGGSTGNAWLIGVTAGLFEGGLDVTGAELIIGTSAGSTAAAQITGASPAQLFADIFAAVPRPPAAPLRSDREPGPAGPTVNHLERTGKIIAAAADVADMRRRMGAAALELDAASDGSWPARWRTTVAARLPSLNWPRQTVLLTAVDVRTGEPVVFDRHSGVDMADAVAASCSSALPYRIGDNQYIDGGYRRNENADLAAGYGRVLVLSPFGGRTRHPLNWGIQLAAQVKELRERGSEVETIVPDNNHGDMFGANAMDPSARPAAARVGYEQGLSLARELGMFWR